MFGERWDRYFLRDALHKTMMSKDPRTRVGAVVVGPDRDVRTSGFNGFPRGIADTHERLNDKELKLKLVVHAELNAVLNAARSGTPGLKGCTLYLAATDETGAVWGGPPCTRCTVELIQAGIAAIVSYAAKEESTWKTDLAMARALIAEAGIKYKEYEPEEVFRVKAQSSTAA